MRSQQKGLRDIGRLTSQAEWGQWDHEETLAFKLAVEAPAAVLSQGGQTALSAHRNEAILSCTQPWLVPNMVAFFSIRLKLRTSKREIAGMHPPHLQQALALIPDEETFELWQQAYMCHPGGAGLDAERQAQRRRRMTRCLCCYSF